jgi:MinD-like ATPase involved in chromosome partitioning or flagellar assembly
MAALVKAAARRPSPAALELLGNRGPFSPGAKGVFAPRPADLAVGRSSSALERARAEWQVTDRQQLLDAAILQPRLQRCATIAVVSPKGGVGKTTISALVGMLLSHLRRDRVVAVDANPDYGSLGRVLTPNQDLFVDDLLVRMAQPDLTLTELDSQLGRAAHGLMVLPSPTDPQRMAQLDEPGYRTVITRLKEYAGVIILDCGPGLQEPAVKAALTTCDQIVLVTDAEPATASLVAESSTMLAAGGRPITVVVNKMPRRPRLDLDRFATFVPVATAMLTIPANTDGADLLGSGSFDWRHAPKPWATAVRELAAGLAGDWPRLGLTLRPGAQAEVEMER